MHIQAIRVHQHGGPDSMLWESVELADPGPGEIRVRHHAVGLNYIDVYHRTGLYPTPDAPFSPGLEAAGVVEAVGEGVKDLSSGDRVAYASPPLGAYAEARNIPADRVVKLPDGIDFEQGAAMMLQGMTVEYLLRRTFPVQAGQTILYHAAAGGVGLIFGQWAKHIGATVIGTVGSEEKAELARAHGYDHTILYREEDVPARVRELTGGAGVPVVYDGVGKDTWDMSLDCLAARGLMVSFGNASGKVPPLELGTLTAKGSLYVTRPTLMTYTADSGEMRASARALFDVVTSGAVRIEVNQRYPLAEATEAHRALEARETTGSTVFTV
ncbi:MAG: quinone oxidoreductase family protein [Gammaproteobacteria bacterium]